MISNNGPEFPVTVSSGLILAGLGAVVPGVIEVAEAQQLEKRLDQKAIAEAKAIFDKFASDPRTLAALNKLNAEPGKGMRFATIPPEVVAAYLSAAPELKKCGVTSIQIGVEITTPGNAKMVMKLITNQKGADGQPVFHQFSRTLTKR